LKTTLAVDVELGKCVEQSNIIHVVAEKAEMGGHRPKCNQGRVKFAEGKNPTTLRFPAEGDVSQVKVKGLDGLICGRCLKVMQSEEAARRAPVEAPPAKRPAPSPVINAVEKIAELKAEYLAGKIDWPTYEKKAKFWDQAARHVGLLGAPLPPRTGKTEGSSPVVHRHRDHSAYSLCGELLVTISGAVKETVTCTGCVGLSAGLVEAR
jgi:hypothetical protein